MLHVTTLVYGMPGVAFSDIRSDKKSLRRRTMRWQPLYSGHLSQLQRSQTGRKKWSGRVDLNHRPPGPEDWSHEESTSCTEGDELLRNPTSITIPDEYRSAVNSR